MKKKTTSPKKLKKQEQKENQQNIYVFPHKPKTSFPYHKVILFLLIIFAAIALVIHDSKNTMSLEKTKSVVELIANSGYKLTSFYAKEVLNQWEKYEKLLKRTDEKEHIHVDIITQLHDFPEAINQREAERKIKKSQNKVFDLLVTLKPDVVTFEGSSLANVTFDALIDEITEGIQKQGASMPREEIVKTMNNTIAQGLDGTTRFLKENKDTLIIGQEEEEVLILHNQVINIYGAESSESKAVSYLRSRIAIAKLIIALSENNKTHGALPIGFMHEITCIRELERLKIHYKIYSTVD